MMRRILTFFILALAVLVPVLTNAHSFAAVDALNLISSPLPILLEAKPGQTVSTELRVKNANSNTERLKVNLLKFQSDNNGKVQIVERQEGDDYFDWVTLTPTSFDALPNEWKSVKMDIKLPSSAAYGYYYAVGFSRANQKIDKSQTANIQGQVITFVLLNANAAGAKRELAIDSFAVNKKSFEFLPANFTVKLKNTGNIHLAPHGNIFIYKGSKKVSTLSINQALGNVLPNSARVFNADWKEGFPVYQNKVEDGVPVRDEIGNPKQSLQWNFTKLPNLRFGKYTAKLVMVYNDGQHDIPLEASVSFWVIPWRIIIVGTIILVLVCIGLWSTGKNIWRKVKGGSKKDKKDKK